VGKARGILKAHDFIVERIQEKQQQKPQQPDASTLSSAKCDPEMAERLNQIKLLVPNTTAGLLIGKAGSFIKQIKDESGAFVQISSKQVDLPERIVSIEGDTEKRNKALQLVIKRIAVDPQHNSVPCLSYSTLNVINASQSSHTGNTNGQDFMHGSGPGSSSNSSYNNYNNAGLNGLALLIMNCGGSFQMSAESLKLTLRNSGYTGTASMEIIEAITVLLSYGLINKVPLSLPGPHQQANSTISNFPAMNGMSRAASDSFNPNYHHHNNSSSQNGVGGHFNSSHHQQNAAPYQNNMYQSNMHSSQSFHNNSQQQQQQHNPQQHRNNANGNSYTARSSHSNSSVKRIKK
jgi:RNA-binding protein Nova